MNKGHSYLNKSNGAEALRLEKRRSVFGRSVFAAIILFALFTFIFAGIYAGQSDLMPDWIADYELASDRLDGDLVAHAVDQDAQYTDSRTWSVDIDAFNTSSRTITSVQAYASGETEDSITNEYRCSARATITLSGSIITKLREQGKLEYKISVCDYYCTHNDNCKNYGIYNGEAYLFIDGVRQSASTESSAKSSWQPCNFTSIGSYCRVYAKGKNNIFKDNGVSYAHAKIQIQLRSTDTTAPTFSVDTDDSLNGTINWSKGRKVTYTINEACVPSTSFSSNTCSYQYLNSSNQAVAGTTTPVYVSTTSTKYKYQTKEEVVSDLTVSAKDRSNNSNSATFSLVRMKIDRVSPTVSGVGFYKGGTTTAVDTYTRTGTVDIRCTVVDAESGVGDSSTAIVNNSGVVAVNNATGVSYTGTLASGSYANGTWVFSGVTNGSYTITATDGVGWTGTGTGSYYGIDGCKPVVSINNYASSFNSYGYATGAVHLVFTVTDVAGWSGNNNEATIANYSSTATAYRNRRGVSFTITGPNKETGTVETITHESNLVSYTNGKYTYTYTVDMAFSGAYNYVVTDSAGNSVEDTIGAKIDTTAPRITTVSASAGKDSWTKDNITLTVSATDAVSSTYTSYVNKYTESDGNGLLNAELIVSQCTAGSGYTVGQRYGSVQTFGNSTSVSFTVSANYSAIQKYEIVVYDKAGNSTRMTPTYQDTSLPQETDSNNVTHRYAAYNSVHYWNYKINENVPQGNATDKRYITLLKDSVTVTLDIYGSNPLTDASAVLYAEKDDTFTDQWRSQNSRTFYLKVTFGASGGSIYQKVNGEGRQAMSAYSASFPDASTAGNASYCKDDNVLVIAYTTESKGENSYQFEFQNRTQTKFNSGTMITRLDTTGPSVKLLGFGTSIAGTFANEAAVINGISANFTANGKMLSESDLYSMDGWLGSSCYAYLLIEDEEGGSGVDRSSQTYSVNNSTDASQVSRATVTVTFAQNGYASTAEVYTKTGVLAHYDNGVFKDPSNNTVSADAVYYPTKMGSVYVLEVPLFGYKDNNPSGALLRAAKKGGNSIVNGNTLDLAYGQNQPFSYTITVHDFAGNTAPVHNSNSSATLNYKVDPFDPDMAVASVQYLDDSSVYQNYTCTPMGGNWTKKQVKITVNKTQMCLSTTSVTYHTVNIVDVLNADGTINSVTNLRENTNNLPSTTDTNEWHSTVDSGNQAILTLDATCRSVQVFFAINARGGTVSHTFMYFGGKAICIRQDTQAPSVEQVFFSTSNSIGADYATNANVLLRYEVRKISGEWKLVRTGAHVSDTNVFTNQKVYMYILATDFYGSMNGNVAVGELGSGIQYVSTRVNGGTETYYTYGDSAKKVYNQSSGMYYYLYRSGPTATYGYLDTSATYGISDLTIYDNQNNHASYVFDRDSNNKKLFPIVDDVVPYLTIESATYGQTSYLIDGKFAGSNGVPIKDDLNVTFSYRSGISDAWIYVRKRDFGVVLTPADDDLVKYSGDIDTFGFLTDAGVSMTSLAADGHPVFAGWTYISNKTVSGTTISANSDYVGWDYTIVKSSIKNRYDILIVNGAGAYYYMDGGDVFIDVDAPIFNNDAIFLALASDDHNNAGEIEYDSLTLIPESDLSFGNPFTNDSVYAYFYVSDAASGVERVVYTSGSNVEVPLEKVTLIRNSTTYAKGNGKGDGYYRLELTSGTITYSVTAYDLAGNSSASRGVTPPIDNDEMQVQVKWSSSTSNTYNTGSYTKDAYVKLILTATAGKSGLSHVEYSKNGTTWSTLAKATNNIVPMEDINVVSTGDNKKEYTIYFRQEQSTRYYFRAYNGVYNSAAPHNQYAKYENGVQVLPFETPNAEYYEVQIDKTAPNINTGLGNYNALMEWHSVPKNPQLVVSDPNDYGSGVKTVVISYTVGSGLETENKNFSLSYDSEHGWYTSMPAEGDPDVLDHYVLYTVTMTDRAGNSTTESFTPKIDTVRPAFIPYEYEAAPVEVGESVTGYYKKVGNTYQKITEAAVAEEAATYYVPSVWVYNTTKKADDDIYDDLIENAYTVGNSDDALWTNMNVLTSFNAFYSISGYKLMYRSVNGGGTISEQTPWHLWENSEHLWDDDVNADGAMVDGATHIATDLSILFSVLAGANMDKTYQIKLVSYSGLESDVYTIGRISIDKEKPNLQGNVFEKTDPTNGGQRIWDGEWTKENLYIYMNMPGSNLVSGYSFFYNLTDDDAYWIEVPYTFVSNDVFKLNYSNKTFLHVLKSTTETVTYRYYVRSKSGMVSDTFVAENIRIDKQELTSSLNADIKASTVYGTPQGEGKWNVATESDYNSGEVLTAGEWASSNSIILHVYFRMNAYSGLTLYIDDVEYETFAYADYEPNGLIHRYYAIDKKADVKIQLVSGSGMTATVTKVILIDNVSPMLYVSGITGTKSSNWDDTYDNSWYVSSTKINFTVGTLVKEGMNYVWSDTAPVSSYTIEYSVDGGQTWLSNGTSTILTIIGNPYVQSSYLFRIKNGANLYYHLGQAARDNNGQVAASVARCTEILTAQDALTSHLSEMDSFVYNVNVDSNTYYVIDSQILTYALPNGNVVEATTKTDFATYSYSIFRDGSYQDLIPGEDDLVFHRGDLISISYVANVAQDYLHDYTDYGVIGENNAWVERDYDGNKIYKDSTVNTVDGKDVEQRYKRFTDEFSAEEGEFTYRFSDSSVTFFAHYVKQIEVTYGNVILYKQQDSVANVSASTRYYYDSTAANVATIDIPVELSLSYTLMNGTTPADPTALNLGGYLVHASIVGDVNSKSFRLKNDKTVLLVKYFTEELDNSGNEIANSTAHPYAINSSADLAYVSESYYDSYNASTFVLGEQKSYLVSAYRVEEDLVVNSAIGISGRFLGSFAGNDKTITMTAQSATSKFGFFEDFAGTASAFGIKIGNVLRVADAATEVGAFAAKMSGGTVKNVRVQGDMTLVSMSANAAVGGFVGKVTAGQIGASDGSVYVDIVMNNYGNAISSADIGGAVGYLGTDAILYYVYAYSYLTVYNVNSSHVGALVGNLQTTTYGSNRNNHFFNNRYMVKNTFVNDEAVAGFAGVSNDVNDASETENTVKGMTYASFVNTVAGEGGTTVLNKTIRTMVLDRLYADFGLEEGTTYPQGTGESDRKPLVIASVSMLEMVDKYMNVCFRLESNLDLVAWETAIGLHKVYNGTFDGNYATISNFGAGLSLADGDRVGLFAEVSGRVERIIFTDVMMDIDTTLGTLYAGTVVAKLSGGTINDIIAIGTMDVSSTDVVYAGALVGTAEGGNVYDVLSIVNVKATSYEVHAGGIAAYVNDTRIGSYENNGPVLGPVFGLGRVESVTTGGSSLVGAIIGDGTRAAIAGTAYAVRDNAYSNGNFDSNNRANATLVDFDNMDMRNASFSTGESSAFATVFSGIYRLDGNSTADEGFFIRNEEDFKYIDQMLYAKYNIANDITFTDFRTIGKGLVFSGSINGKNSENWSAETGTVSTLMNVTDALVDTNAGTISDFGVNITYTVTTNENLVFGAIANYNNLGTIRNVTVGGQITVNAAMTSTVTVSGFIGIAYGGSVAHDNRIQNSISGLDITINGAGAVYAGGYVGTIDGEMTLTYGIGNGTLIITGQDNTVYAGSLVGRVLKDTTYKGVEATEDYRYEVIVNGTPTDRLFGYEAAGVILHIDE